MSIASILAGALGIKKKHPAVQQYEDDVKLFRDFRVKIEAEQDRKKKADLLKSALSLLRDANRNTVAKMVFAAFVGDAAEWDGVVEQYGNAIQRALDKDDIAREFGAGAMQRAQAKLPFLMRSLDSLAMNWESFDDRQRAWQGYLNQKGAIVDAMAIWKSIAAQRDDGKRQQLLGLIWTRANDEKLRDIVRLEIVDPKNPLVSEWKVLAQRFAKGDDVARDLQDRTQTIARALPKKLEEFAGKTFGVSVTA